MKQQIRDAIATQLKSLIRQAEKYKHNTAIYKELDKVINELKDIDNKIALTEETTLIKFLKEKGA